MTESTEGFDYFFHNAQISRLSNRPVVRNVVTWSSNQSRFKPNLTAECVCVCVSGRSVSNGSELTRTVISRALCVCALLWSYLGELGHGGRSPLMN